MTPSTMRGTRRRFRGVRSSRLPLRELASGFCGEAKWLPGWVRRTSVRPARAPADGAAGSGEMMVLSLSEDELKSDGRIVERTSNGL